MFQQRSPLTRDSSLSLIFGVTSETSSVFLVSASQHTTHRQMIFYRHSKTGLRAGLAGSNWVDDLLIVLPGICLQPSWKTCHTHQEKWYMAQLCICQETSPLPPRCSTSCSVPVSVHGRHAVYFPPDLHKDTDRYVQHDSQKPPLTHPYDGLFWDSLLF